MLSVIKRLRYRDEVLQRLGTLLVMYPRRRQFAADFPGLRDLLRAHFQAGVSSTGSALQLSVTIIEALARQLAARDRAAVSAQLNETDWSELQRTTARQLAGKPWPARDAATFAAQLIGGAIFMARRMAEEGTLGRAEYAFLLWELDRILRHDPAVRDPRPSPGRPRQELFPLNPKRDQNRRA